MESGPHNMKWENHSWIVMNRLANFYGRDLLIDCTIYVEGVIIHVHRNILAAASPYFEGLFTAEPHKNYFEFADLKHKDVKAVIDFMYFGFVKLPKDDMISFLRAAEKFHIQILDDHLWDEEGATAGQPLENREEASERRDSFSDDWSSLTGNNTIKQEPMDCVSSDVLPYVVGNSTGADELRGYAEPFISSSCQRRRTSGQRTSKTPPGNSASRAQVKERKNEREVDSRGAAVSPTSRKSPLKLRSGLVSPSRTVVPNPPKDDMRSRRKRVEKQSPVQNTSPKSPKSSGKKSWETPSRTRAPSSPRKRLLAPTENLESASLSDRMASSHERGNSQRETSLVKRQSRSRSPTNIREKPQTEESPTVCRSESASRDRILVSNTPVAEMESGSESVNTCALVAPLSSSTPLSNRTKSDSNRRETRKTQKEKPKEEVERSTRTVAKGKRKRKRRDVSSSSEREVDTTPVKKGRKMDLTCKFCGEEFLTFGRFVTHVRSHKGESHFPCTVCNKRFEDWTSFTEHRKVCFFQCEICKKVLTRRYSLKDHMNTHSSERPYKCKICGKAFKGSGTLSIHVRAHRGEKPYVCDVCGKSFSVRSSLNSHQRIHSDKRPFVCEVCGRGFKDKSTLRKHGVTHTGEKSFHCEICDSSFANKPTLERHIYHHMDDSAKQYSCKVCDKQFAIPFYLQKHLQVHTDERPYSCKICGSSFRQRHHLKRHEISLHSLKQ